MLLESTQSYIDIGTVNEDGEMEKKFQDLIVWEKIDLDNPSFFNVCVDEHRYFLNDDCFNFMGLSEPKEVIYLNPDTTRTHKWPKNH